MVKNGKRIRTYLEKTSSMLNCSFASNDDEGWEICCYKDDREDGDCDLFYDFRRIAITQCFVPRFIGNYGVTMVITYRYHNNKTLSMMFAMP